MPANLPSNSTRHPVPQDLAASLLRLPLYPLRLAPPRLVSLALERMLSLTLIQQQEAGELDFLDGRWLLIRIDDIGLHWVITRDHEQWRVLDKRQATDATISGQAREFILLASRQEDPDTLFFQRRLVIEGDVEFGLQAKNLLDSLEWDALPAPLRWLLSKAGHLAAIS